jgi:hypothetical protein
VQKTDFSWTPFAVVPGRDAIPGGIIAKRVAIAGARDGSAQIVVVGEDDTVYHTVRFANGTWQAQGFAPLDSPIEPYFKARDVAISIFASTSSTPGLAEVVAISLSNGQIYDRMRSSTSWTPFSPVPGSAGMNSFKLAIASGEDGNAYVLATALMPDGTVQIKRQVRYPSSWDPGFLTVPTDPSAVVRVGTNIALTLTPGSSKAQLVYTDQAGGTWFQERTNPINQASWTAPVPNLKLATSGSRTVSISAQPNGIGPSEVTIVRTSPQ